MPNHEGTVTGERRLELRYAASSIPGITGARLSPGDTVEIVDLSRSGILVEGNVRMVPGMRVAVVIEGLATPLQIRGRVVRCHVTSLDGGVLHYRTGIRFDELLSTHPTELGSGSTAAPAPDPAAAGQPPASEAPAAPTPNRPANRW